MSILLNITALKPKNKANVVFDKINFIYTRITILYIIIISSLTYPLTSYAKSAPWVGTTLEGFACRGGRQGYGPYDYTKVASIGKERLHIVESAHFTPNVENLIRGNTSLSPVKDIDYTLRAWPNHHKALLSIIRYQLRIKHGLIKDKLKTPPECFLQRAISFSPKDSRSYILYGYYLKKLGQLKQAKKQYKKALQIEPNNAKSEYSYSLLLIELKEYNDALKYAKLSYQHSKSTPKGLRNKLKKLGVWQ